MGGANININDLFSMFMGGGGGGGRMPGGGRAGQTFEYRFG